MYPYYEMIGSLLVEESKEKFPLMDGKGLKSLEGFKKEMQRPPIFMCHVNAYTGVKL